jgi:hypothetical protein
MARDRTRDRAVRKACGEPLHRRRRCGIFPPLVNRIPARALVVLRVPRGAAPPPEHDIRAALTADRTHLALPPADLVSYQLAGPYRIEVAGQPLDEYVAWEI